MDRIQRWHFAVGQTVQVWDAGVVLESYPGQATAHRIVVVPAPSAVPANGDVAPPQRAPDVRGIITQASNTIWIDGETVLILTASTHYYRRSAAGIEPVDAGAVAPGQQVEVWVDSPRYTPQPQGTVIALAILDQ